ncbi:MAG: cupredoxin domain-containing protein [Tepidiformaceae bacterium]
MRRLYLPCVLISLCVGLASLTACGGGGGEDEASASSRPSAARPATERPAASVAVLDNLFNPGQRSIKVGDEVNWDWNGTNAHSVVGTFDGAAVDSGQKSGSNRFTFKFEKAGTFEYHCGVHGAAMSGKITIQ